MKLLKKCSGEPCSV